MGVITENVATQLLHRAELVGLERDTVPGDALCLHRSLHFSPIQSHDSVTALGADFTVSQETAA
jgi:hypothetical protein